MANVDAAEKKSDSAAAGSDDGGTLTVNRKPSVGSGVFVALSVDGKPVRRLMQGSRYRGPLSAGKHVIAVMPEPNTSGQKESKVEVTAEKGRTYSFSVSRDKAGNIGLMKNP